MGRILKGRKVLLLSRPSGPNAPLIIGNLFLFSIIFLQFLAYVLLCGDTLHICYCGISIVISLLSVLCQVSIKISLLSSFVSLESFLFISLLFCSLIWRENCILFILYITCNVQLSTIWKEKKSSTIVVIKYTHNIHHTCRYIIWTDKTVFYYSTCTITLLNVVTLFIKFRTHNNVVIIAKHNSCCCQIIPLT